MKELNMVNILKNHGINVIHIRGELYAEEVYTQNGELHSELVLVDCEKGTVHGEPIYHWLGY